MRDVPPTSGLATGKALVLNDVVARIGTSQILHGITFEAPTSGVTVILGRNGAGKTTTLRAIVGLQSSTGEIIKHGQIISELPAHVICRQQIGYVPEDRDVFAGLSVAENLRIAERRGDVHRYDLIDELFPDLMEKARRPAGTLSGGQQQMLSLARALLNENSILIVDEPSKGLAPKLVSDLVGVLERIKAQATILMVEQNIGVARRLADWVVIIEDGLVVASGAADDVLADDRLVQSALGVSNRSTGVHT